MPLSSLVTANSTQSAPTTVYTVDCDLCVVARARGGERGLGGLHIKSTRLGSEMGSLTSRCTGDVRCISLSQDSVVSEQCAVRASSQSQLSRLLGGRHRYLASGVCLLLAVQGYFPSHCGAELCAPTRTADKHRLPAFALRVEWGRGILWKGCDRDRWGAAKKHQPYTRRTPNIASAPSPSTDCLRSKVTV